ncbi:MAG: thioredoxin family protein [Planctomycetota bacterium]
MTAAKTLPPLNAQFLRSKHEAGLTYQDYLATDSVKAEPWQSIHEQVALSEDHRRLLDTFTRSMNVICVSGIWCGDCVQQGPLLQHIADASPIINLRWLDRDEHSDLSEQIMINAGQRVPTVIFLAEDYEPVSILGDRSLTRYRAIAAKQLGASCPVPGAPVPDEELIDTLQDWLDEFERVQLLLRLSGRLRKLHQD